MSPPIATDQLQEEVSKISLLKEKNQAEHAAATRNESTYFTEGPLKSTGVLDKYESFDVTPVIGKEFPTANLVDWINAPNADELLRELALTISQRGVVFFRKQDNLTNDLQKALIHRLGQLAGKPSTSTLHIHPVLNTESEFGEKREPDNEISTISSRVFNKLYGIDLDDSLSHKKQSSNQWHADISFEPVPADYTSLRLTELPKNGGDTLWASGYEVYDRISEPYQKFLETLSVTFAQPGFNAAAERSGIEIYDKPRGSPENVGKVLKAVHPVVRTNPVTGWKSIFPIGSHISHVNGVTGAESKRLLDWFLELLVQNHDLQVRFRWQNENDIAIWDNRSVFHNATFDYKNLGDRHGSRAVGIGEKPFFDPKSTGRREALEKAGAVVGEPFQTWD